MRAMAMMVAEPAWDDNVETIGIRRQHAGGGGAHAVRGRRGCGVPDHPAAVQHARGECGDRYPRAGGQSIYR